VFYRAMGLAGDVRKQFERARSLCPENLEAHSDLLDFYIRAPGIIGGGKEKARLQAQEIARVSAKMGYQARARIAEKAKNWDEALRELKGGVNAFPQDPAPYGDLSEFHFHRQSYAAAAAAARRALQLRPDYPRAQFLLAASEIMTGVDPARAVAVLQGLSRRSLTDEDPPFQDIYYWLGRGLLAAGRRSDAEQALEAALRFDPDHGEARKTLQQVRVAP
jgi:tetratricopeptide (TPR) repeat protein